MGLFVEKMIAVTMAENRHFVDEAFLGLRTAAVIRRDLAANAKDRDLFEKAVRELDEGLWQRGHALDALLRSALDYAAEVIVDETSARTMADGTYFVARVLHGLRDTAQALRRCAGNTLDRARFEKAEHEIADAIQRIRNSWDGRQSALEIILEKFSVEAITDDTDFVPEILRELLRTARLGCEFADDYSRDRLEKAVRELDEALRRLDTKGETK
jgi:hypothetical protein